MNNRMIAAGFGAVLAAGAALMPAGTWARGGAMGAGGHGFAAHAGFHPVTRGAFFIPHRPPQVMPAHVGPFARSHDFAIAPHRRFVRFFGSGLPIAGIGVYYGDYGDDDDTTGALGPQPIYYPAGVDGWIPQGDPRVANSRGACRTQVVTVRSEGGGERQVNVTRC